MSAAELADDAQVCNCNGVTKGTIAETVHGGSMTVVVREDGAVESWAGQIARGADLEPTIAIDDGDRQPAAQRAEQPPHGLQQVLGDAGALEHDAHEDEQRNGDQHVRGHDAEDALAQRAEQRDLKHPEQPAEARKQHGDAGQGEDDGEAEQDGEPVGEVDQPAQQVPSKRKTLRHAVGGDAAVVCSIGTSTPSTSST